MIRKKHTYRPRDVKSLGTLLFILVVVVVVVVVNRYLNIC